MAASLSSKSLSPSPKQRCASSGKAHRALIVQKYGGTSVGTPEKIRAVAAAIAKRHQQGDQLVVVVSAMGHTTDELISLAQKVSSHPREREMDVLLSVGERISMALLSMALSDLGVEAISFTGSQAGIITTESHTRARIVAMKPVRVREELSKNRVVIVAGFQGVSTTKEITTLGRGGSDTTAVALAKALSADRCEVYTDVAGIYSADPRRVPAAKRYEILPPALVLEMAVQGAQVMHGRSIELVRADTSSEILHGKNRAVPLWVGQVDGPNSNQEKNQTLEQIPKRGTLIMETGHDDKQAVSELPSVVAVVKRAGLIRFTLKPNNMVEFLGTLEGLIVHDLKISVQGQLAIVLDPSECGQFLADNHWPQRLDSESQAAITSRSGDLLRAEPMASLAVIGAHIQQDATVAQRMAMVLEKIGVKDYELSALSQGVRLWVSESVDLDLAVSSLHESLVV